MIKVTLSLSHRFELFGLSRNARRRRGTDFTHCLPYLGIDSAWASTARRDTLNGTFRLATCFSNRLLDGFPGHATFRGRRIFADNKPRRIHIDYGVVLYKADNVTWISVQPN
jgi:hypothetical protein